MSALVERETKKLGGSVRRPRREGEDRRRGRERRRSLNVRETREIDRRDSIANSG